MGGCASKDKDADERQKQYDKERQAQYANYRQQYGRPHPAHSGTLSHAASVPLKPDFGVNDTHELIRELGRGAYGQTWLTKHRETGTLVAIKFIKRPLPKAILPMFAREVKIQGEIGEGHLNIINADEVCLTRTHIGLVMEYAAGGSLTQYITAKMQTKQLRGGLCITEDEARYLFHQMVDAVEYCHKKHVAHRDLKLDNTILDGSDPPYIKLCDFGFAKDWADGEDAQMQTQCGSLVYGSPQLVRGEGTYDGQKADVWALGVLLVVMMLGKFPFDDGPDPDSYGAKLKVWMQQVGGQWRENPTIKAYVELLSPECLDMLDKIFVVDEKERIKVDGLKKHTWMNIPLLPIHKAALDKLRLEQSQLDVFFQDQQASARKTMYSQLDKLLEQGTRPALPTEQAQWLLLHRSKRTLSNRKSMDASRKPNLSALRESIGEVLDEKDVALKAA